MPVVLEQGASGRSFNLLNGVRCAPADPARNDGAIEIGIVNNMPDAALELTERQFIGLLAAASGKTQVRVRLFALPQIGRGEFARRRLLSDYAEIGRLWDTRLDGLIVSGMEPGPGPLREEPYWRMFTELIDWADRQTTSSIWSCLAAHAAVLHRDGSNAVRSPQVLRRLRVHQGNRSPPAGRRAGARAGSPFALERRAGRCAGGRGL